VSKVLILTSPREAANLEEELSQKQRFGLEFTKRALDLILAILVGATTLLLLPFIALAIRLESRGPILFRQKRVGKDGDIFELVKFRSTFRTAVDESVGWDKEEGEVYTKTGKFLRKNYFDELPQVINVLRGEMSFIGPRPERPEFVEILRREIPFYEMRLLIRPGLSGWAQINMDNDASAKDAAEKLQYDLYYLKYCSLWLDLKIALKTLAIILQREGK